MSLGMDELGGWLPPEKFQFHVQADILDRVRSASDRFGIPIDQFITEAFRAETRRLKQILPQSPEEAEMQRIMQGTNPSDPSQLVIDVIVDRALRCALVAIEQPELFDQASPIPGTDLPSMDLPDGNLSEDDELPPANGL